MFFKCELPFALERTPGIDFLHVHPELICRNGIVMMMPLLFGIEDGKGEQDLTESAWKKEQKLMYVRHYGSKVTVTFNEKAIAEEKKNHGYFDLVSTCEKDSFEWPRKYLKRSVIKFLLESGKQRTDGNRTRIPQKTVLVC